MSKTKILSLTKKDFKIDYFRGSGAGGQKKNKTNSGVRIRHLDSGAIGKATDTRYQHKNKKLAFHRLVESERFKRWLKIKCSRSDYIFQEVEKSLEFVKIESKDEQGRWTEGLTEQEQYYAKKTKRTRNSQ